MKAAKIAPVERKMPEPVSLGTFYKTPIIAPLANYREWLDAGCQEDPHGRRMVMGYVVPAWQRPLVWCEAQQIRFLESAWRGLGLGTFTYNRVGHGGPLDNLLIDGQQRLWAIQRYVENAFPIFGYHWGEITLADQREFRTSRIFASYETRSTDEAYLRSYYDLMNFGGVAHTEDQRAAGDRITNG